MEVKAKTLIFYQTISGKIPFSEWFSDLKDRRAKAAIDARLTRLRQGNFGLCRSLKSGIWELKVDLGPGYRVYFGLHEKDIVLLLYGGDKGTQEPDIELAREYWSDYLQDLKSK